MEAAAHVRGHLHRAEMTALEGRDLLVDWLLRRLVLLEIARARRLSVAVDEVVEIDHALSVGAEPEEEESGDASEDEEEKDDDGDEYDYAGTFLLGL